MCDFPRIAFPACLGAVLYFSRIAYQFQSSCFSRAIFRIILKFLVPSIQVTFSSRIQIATMSGSKANKHAPANDGAESSDDEEVSLGDVQETNPIVETTKAVAKCASKSEKDEDFSNRLAQDQIDDVTLIFRDGPADSNMANMVDIVQEEDIDPTKDERVYARRIWLPPMRAEFVILHGCGPDPLKPKYPVDNVAGRTYGFSVGTYMDPGVVAKYNGERQGDMPGFDIKDDHEFTNTQMKKLIDKIIEGLWENEGFAKTVKQKHKEVAIAQLARPTINEWKRMLDDGEIDRKEHAKLVKTVDQTVDKKELQELCKSMFIQNCSVPMMENLDHPGEYLYNIKIPVFRKTDPSAKLDPIRPEVVTKRFEQDIERKKARGKVLNKKEQRVLRTEITKKVVEKDGNYQLNRIIFTDHNNVPTNPETYHYRTQIVWQNFIVRGCVTLTAQCTTGKEGKYGIKMRGMPRIQIIQTGIPPVYSVDPEESPHGEDWTINSITKIVGEDRMAIDEDVEVETDEDDPPKTKKRKHTGEDEDGESRGAHSGKIKKMKKSAPVQEEKKKKKKKKSKESSKSKHKKPIASVAPEPESSDEEMAEPDEDEMSEHEKSERKESKKSGESSGEESGDESDEE
jgi:hypothetical protein